MSHAVRYLRSQLEDQKAKLEAVEIQEADAIAGGIEAQRRVDAQREVVDELSNAIAILELPSGISETRGLIGD